MILDALFFFLAVIILLLMAYLFFLAAAARLPARALPEHPPLQRFAVIIPARNEAATIGATLRGLSGLDYPEELREIIVIADNCRDKTAEIAREQGALCLQRHDPARQGKGFALGWAFPHLLARGGHDAYLVIDADTRLAPDYLRIMNRYLAGGEEAIQGYSQVRHPQRSIMESLAFLGFALNRNLRYRGRSRLGWSANLLGTGMCFSRGLLERLGWNTTTLVEDIEYTMFLLVNGKRVIFAPEARLEVELHPGVGKSGGQRRRWDMGKFEVRNRYVALLLRAAWTRRDPRCFDAALELLLPPFSIFVLLVLVAAGLFFLLDYHGPSLGSFFWAAAVAGLAGYIFIGLISARAPAAVYRALVYAPFFLFWRLWILAGQALGKRGRGQW